MTAPAQDADDIGLALDADDLDEMRAAVRNPDAVVTDTPNDQKLRRFSVVCVIVNRMIGEPPNSGVRARARQNANASGKKKEAVSS